MMFYDIERILAKRTLKDNQFEYLVFWKGYSIEDSTWEPSNRLKEDYCRAYCDSLKKAFLDYDEEIVSMIVKLPNKAPAKQLFTDLLATPAEKESIDERDANKCDSCDLLELSTELPPAAADVTESLMDITGRRSIREFRMRELSTDDSFHSPAPGVDKDANAVSESLGHITGRRSIREFRMRETTDETSTSSGRVRVDEGEEAPTAVHEKSRCVLQ